MAVHLHRSNRSERLVDELAAVLAAPPANPFAADVVVVLGLLSWWEPAYAATPTLVTCAWLSADGERGDPSAVENGLRQLFDQLDEAIDASGTPLDALKAWMKGMEAGG